MHKRSGILGKVHVDNTEQCESGNRGTVRAVPRWFFDRFRLFPTFSDFFRVFTTSACDLVWPMLCWVHSLGFQKFAEKQNRGGIRHFLQNVDTLSPYPDFFGTEFDFSCYNVTHPKKYHNLKKARCRYVREYTNHIRREYSVFTRDTVKNHCPDSPKDLSARAHGPLGACQRQG